MKLFIAKHGLTTVRIFFALNFVALVFLKMMIDDIPIFVRYSFFLSIGLLAGYHLALFSMKLLKSKEVNRDLNLN